MIYLNACRSRLRSYSDCNGQVRLWWKQKGREFEPLRARHRRFLFYILRNTKARQPKTGMTVNPIQSMLRGEEFTRCAINQTGGAETWRAPLSLLPFNAGKHVGDLAEVGRRVHFGKANTDQLDG
jgi:hypothetical protein